MRAGRGSGGSGLTSLMRVGRAKLETDRIIMQDKDSGLKTQCQMIGSAPQIDWPPGEMVKLENLEMVQKVCL